jgi:hypothetical protein
MKVRYIGLLENGDMLYRAISDDKESLAVNPIKGTVVIVFQSCFEVPNSKTLTPEPEKKCNTITHYFGNIAPGNIK